MQNYWIDEILRNYGYAYRVNFDMTDMRNMGNINKGSMVENNNGSNLNINSNVDMNKMKDMPPSVNDSDTKIITNKPIVNMANYQSAKGLAEKLLDIYNKELKPIISQNGTSMMTNLESGIIQLVNSIESKVPPKEITMIVHTQIHPNLIKAFNLQIF